MPMRDYAPPVSWVRRRRHRCRQEADPPRPDDGRPVVTPRSYREIRSALFPAGLPDRTDSTVIEAFTGAWLLLEHSPSGCRLAGVADDYEAAREWLVEQPDGEQPGQP